MKEEIKVKNKEGITENVFKQFIELTNEYVGNLKKLEGLPTEIVTMFENMASSLVTYNI